MKNKNLRIVAASAVILGSLLTGGTALADTDTAGNTTNTTTQLAHMGRMGGMHRPGVFGEVTAVNGTMLTVTDKGRPNRDGTTDSRATVTIYSVDASGATIEKNGNVSTIAAVAVGDRVMIEGTVSGTSVVATKVLDGMPPRGERMGRGRDGFGSSTSPMIAMPQGNGKPIVGGTVTAENGATLTVTTASGIVYTVDATSATFYKRGTTATLSDIALGDEIIVQGRVDGESIAANSIVDHGAKPASTSNASGATVAPGAGKTGGFLGGIGGFFHRMFGFF